MISCLFIYFLQLISGRRRNGAHQCDGLRGRERQLYGARLLQRLGDVQWKHDKHAAVEQRRSICGVRLALSCGCHSFAAHQQLLGLT